MEEDKKIEELTQALAKIKVEETHLKAQLTETLLRRARRSDQKTQQTTYTDRIHGFAQGDRVWVQNAIRKPANWDDSAGTWKQEKRATVTEVLIKGPTVQVHFETDNGVKTWRAPNNLRICRRLRHE